MKPEVKEAVAVIDRELERQWGERCDDFEVSCRTCQAWRARDDVFNWLEFDPDEAREPDDG